MKKAIVPFALAFLCMQLSAMEIEVQTKFDSERTPLKEDILRSQTQTRNNSNNSRFIKKASTYSGYMAQLPNKVNAIIYGKLFEIDKKVAKKFATKSADMVIHYFVHEVHPFLRPFILGNKTFESSDLLALPRTQRIQLWEMAHPHYMDRLYGISNRVIRGYDLTGNDGNNKDYDNLKAMPKNITDDLEISMIDKRTYNCTGRTRWCGFGCAGISIILSLITCWGSCGCCGIIPGCIPKAIALNMIKTAGGFLGGPITCEGCNCIQIHCCSEPEKCDFSEGRELKIN